MSHRDPGVFDRADLLAAIGLEAVQLGVLSIVFAGTVGALKSTPKPD